VNGCGNRGDNLELRGSRPHSRYPRYPREGRPTVRDCPTLLLPSPSPSPSSPYLLFGILYTHPRLIRFLGAPSHLLTFSSPRFTYPFPFPFPFPCIQCIHAIIEQTQRSTSNSLSKQGLACNSRHAKQSNAVMNIISYHIMSVVRSFTNSLIHSSIHSSIHSCECCHAIHVTGKFS
jgi:hypothetical protein